MSQRTQEHRQIAVGTPLGDDVLLLQRLKGTERVSGLFEYELTLMSEQRDIAPEDLIGQNLSIRIEATDDQTRVINGYVSAFVQLDPAGRLDRFRATLVPWLWFLTRTADCRIFQDMTVPEVLRTVFQDHGFDKIDDRLTAEYRTWENCVQYRETDFNFVSRLMEQEGIFYFFTHEDGAHHLVLCDSTSAIDEMEGGPELIYRGVQDQSMVDTEHVSSWMVRREVRPGGYAVEAFDFQNPHQDLEAKSSAGASHSASHLEVYDYDANMYTDYTHGETYARMRIEEMQAGHEVISATSNSRRMQAGTMIRLCEHPREAEERDSIVLSTSYDIRVDLYDSAHGIEFDAPIIQCQARAIPATQPYRPPRTTEKPTIPGAQTAFVVGESGEEIWTDEFGRVKVQFHWDRYGAADAESSCWIRVAQNWAGKNWGSMFIPRIGQEVVIEFLDGDPDRPLITGRVYNAQAMPPYALPDHATISTIKTNSSKGGGGFNELRFEDKKDEEQIFLHGQKNVDVRILNDRFETVVNNRHLHVEVDKFEKVDNNRHEKIGTDHKEEIGVDYHLTVGGKQAIKVTDSRSLTVESDVIEVFGANHSEETTGDYYVTAANVVIEASDKLTIKCGDSAVVLDSSGVTVTGSTITIDGDAVDINCGSGTDAGSGSAGSVVEPAAPEDAEDADEADPGEVAEIQREQAEKGEGKYGSTPAPPFKRPDPDDPETEEKTWIEIELVDLDDNPVPGEPYEVTMPDGTRVASGTLNHEGFARIEGIDPGTCKITFPQLDQDTWEPA